MRRGELESTMCGSCGLVLAVKFVRLLNCVFAMPSTGAADGPIREALQAMPMAQRTLLRYPHPHSQSMHMDLQILRMPGCIVNDKLRHR